MVDATPTKPFCYGDLGWFRNPDSATPTLKVSCAWCAFFYPCAAMAGADRMKLPRKVFVLGLVQNNIPRADAIAAIQKAYGVTRGAARKQFDRRRKKLGYPQ